MQAVNKIAEKHKIDIFIHLFYNPIIYAEFEQKISPFKNAGGLMVSLKSPLGPINITWSVSPDNLYSSNNFTNNFYLSAGYEF